MIPKVNDSALSSPSVAARPWRFSRLAAALEAPGSLLVELVPDLRIARTLARVDPASVPDMPDRIIAATALAAQVPLISRDGRIRLSGLPTVW
jgi:predicted nucleic acid-binding protein